MSASKTCRRLTQLACAALALSLGATELALASPEAKVQATVISRRATRVHLELTTPFTPTQARLAEGQTVSLRAGEGEPIQAKLVAISSRYLVLELPAGVSLPEGRLSITGKTKAPPESMAGRGEAPPDSDVRVGRRAPTLSTFRAKPVPKREPVPFRGGAQPVEKPEGQEGEEGKDPGEWTRTDAEGNELTPSGRRANDVRGELLVGVDSVQDDEADVSRITPYARLRLEVRQLGGSDRVSARFYGSVRRPFNTEYDDYTNERMDKENARLTTLAFEIESAQPEHIREFSDRIEFAVGRDLIPRVLEAGVVDGMRLGARFGSVTPFVFGGAASSNNPRHADYDSLIYGGGIRLDHAFSHAGALRLSVAGAQERFRGEGQRDFVETQGDLRYGSFGMNGALVVDFFEPLRDRRKTRITTGALNAYAQLGAHVRVDAGYRERRPLFQSELLQLDLDPTQLLSLDLSARRNMYASLRFRVLDSALDFWVRGEHYQSRNSREATGGVFGIGVRINERHRITAEVAVRKRFRSDSEGRDTLDPFAMLSWLFQGESLMSQLSLVYTDSRPTDVHDRRIAGRLMLDYEIGAGFGVRGYGELDFRSNQVSDADGVTTYLGFGARYRF